MTPAATPPADVHVRWPRDHFYWALLDASLLPTNERATAERLRYLLEPELPEPLEGVHTVFVRVDPKVWIACALPKRVLQGRVASGTVTLAPSEFPDFVRTVAGASVAPDRLNLLLNEFEPPPVRRARQRCTVVAAAWMVLAFTLALLGIERRIAQTRDGAARLRTAREDRIASVLGPSPAGQRLPLELRLAADLRTFRQTRRQSEQVDPARDATDTFTGLLRLWPPDLPTRTDAIVVSDAAVHVRGTVAESEQVQQLASATQGLDELEMGFPSVQSGPGGWNFGIEWRRKKVVRP